jgi:hypothetical protein
MPEETSAANAREHYINQRLDRLEQKLAREDRWWRGGLIAALVFIGISILVAGHHRHHRRPPFPMWMTYGGAARIAPPPWYWNQPYGYYGWGPEGRPPMPPAAAAPPSR